MDPKKFLQDRLRSMFTDPNPTRTDKAGWKSHIHRLVRDEQELSGDRYLWRCVDCGTRLKRKSGVVIQEGK